MLHGINNMDWIKRERDLELDRCDMEWEHEVNIIMNMNTYQKPKLLKCLFIHSSQTTSASLKLH